MLAEFLSLLLEDGPGPEVKFGLPQSSVGSSDGFPLVV